MIKARGYKPWIPNSLEKKCLRDLDSRENWTNILKHERPDESQIQSWKPFRKIFAFNLVLFLGVLSLIFITLEFGQGVRFNEFREDLLGGTILVILTAASMALYVTHLYRRTWNRRAIAILNESQDLM